MDRRAKHTRIIGGRRGFTLIQLLVVMAITAILLGLIFGPLIQGFNLTNRARVQALTQDVARRAIEIGMRDVSNGVFVFDNTQEPINLWVKDPNGVEEAMLLPYAMVDLVPPARAQDQNANLQLSDVDPTTGLAFVRGNISLPLAPGRVIIRYFLGLRNNTCSTGSQPDKPYTNFYDDPAAASLNDHNPVLLYRA